MLLSIAEIFVCNGGYYFRKIIRNDLSLDMMLFTYLEGPLKDVKLSISKREMYIREQPVPYLGWGQLRETIVKEGPCTRIVRVTSFALVHQCTHVLDRKYSYGIFCIIG